MRIFICFFLVLIKKLFHALIYKQPLLSYAIYLTLTSRESTDH